MSIGLYVFKKVDVFVFRKKSCERMSKIVKTENAEMRVQIQYLECIIIVVENQTF